MSIHEAIKAGRNRLGWSHQQLANKVSELEGLKKPLNWQTVQQWENGKSAPKRKRLEHVAVALEMELGDLINAAFREARDADEMNNAWARLKKTRWPFPSIDPDAVEALSTAQRAKLDTAIAAAAAALGIPVTRRDNFPAPTGHQTPAQGSSIGETPALIERRSVKDPRR